MVKRVISNLYVKLMRGQSSGMNTAVQHCKRLFSGDNALLREDSL